MLFSTNLFSHYIVTFSGIYKLQNNHDDHYDDDDNSNNEGTEAGAIIVTLNVRPLRSSFSTANFQLKINL